MVSNILPFRAPRFHQNLSIQDAPPRHLLPNSGKIVRK